MPGPNVLDEYAPRQGDMRERIARALCSVTGADPDGPHINGKPRWEGWEPYADAVLAAMRVPSNAMEDAGAAHCQSFEHAATVWRAMIDAARNGEA